METTRQEITEEHYDFQLENMPPIYIKTLDGQAIKGGFTPAEFYSFLEDTATNYIYFIEDGKYYKQYAKLYTTSGDRIHLCTESYYNYCNISAKSIKK